MARKLLLVCGSRSIGDTLEGCRWAHEILRRHLVALPRGSMLCTGDVKGPEVLALLAAEDMHVRRVVYGLDGSRLDSSFKIGPTWREIGDGSRVVLRARALVADALVARRAGYDVELLALIDPTDHGPRSESYIRCDIAEQKGLIVNRLTLDIADDATELAVA